MGKSSWRIPGILAGLGSLLAVLTQVSPEDAGSHLGGWAKLVGLPQTIKFLPENPDLWVFIVGAVLFLSNGILLFRRWQSARLANSRVKSPQLSEPQKAAVLESAPNILSTALARKLWLEKRYEEFTRTATNIETRSPQILQMTRHDVDRGIAPRQYFTLPEEMRELSNSIRKNAKEDLDIEVDWERASNFDPYRRCDGEEGISDSDHKGRYRRESHRLKMARQAIDEIGTAYRTAIAEQENIVLQHGRMRGE